MSSLLQSWPQLVMKVLLSASFCCPFRTFSRSLALALFPSRSLSLSRALSLSLSHIPFLHFNSYSVQQYLDRPQIMIADDPLAWWRGQSDLPSLCIVARKLLAVFASAIFVEEANSAAGFIVSDRRSGLAKETTEMLVYLRCNRQWLPTVEDEW